MASQPDGKIAQVIGNVVDVEFPEGAIPEILMAIELDFQSGGEKKEGAGAEGGGSTEFLFEPSPRAILERLLPLYVRLTVYRVLVSSVASEMIARRTAMKLASDNAEEMVTLLTRNYNKARQAQITQELAEIIGGAEALKK